MENKKGITFIEIMIVVVIMGILASFTVSSYRSWQQHVRLVNSRDELKSALYRAQQKATAAAGDQDWGIHLATTTYTIFQGNTYDSADPENITWDLKGTNILDPNAAVSDGAGGYGAEIIFSKFTGMTQNTGTIAIFVPAYPTKFKYLTIQSSGQID